MVAGDCNHPNCLVLPFRFPVVRNDQLERESDARLSPEMKIASGEIQLDLHGKEIQPPKGPKFHYVNEGKDTLGDLVRGKQ